MAFTTPIPELIERNSNGLLGKHPNWERMRLGDVVTVQNGAPFKSEHFNTEGRGMPLLRIRDVVRGATETWYDGPYDDEYVVRSGDLVIGMDGDFNHALWNGPPALLNQRVCRLLFHSDVLTKEWVHCVLGGYLQAVNEATPSVTVKHLSSKTIAGLLLPLPPPEEQVRIVAAIRRYQAQANYGVQSFARARQGLHIYRGAVLQEALGHCVVPSGAEPGERLPRLPDGWVWSAVAKEGTVQLGRMLNKERSSGPYMRPYLRVANVLDDELDLTDVKQMDFPPREYDRYCLHPGDILLNEGQSPELLGRAAMYRGELPGVCFQKTLLRFRAGERVDPEFALLVFRHYLYAGRFRRESRITTGIGHLTAVRFEAMEFPVPPLAEQRDLVAAVRRQLAGTSELEAVLDKLEAPVRQLSTAVLRVAVTGELTERALGDRAAVELTQRAVDQSRERDRRPKKARAVPVGEYL